MRVEINSAVILENIKKAEEICDSINATCSIMVKDFYTGLKIQNKVKNKIWSSKNVRNSYNYILFKNNIWRHKGGLVITKEEIVKGIKKIK